MTENEKYVYDLFLISVKSGFESLDDIIEDILEAVEDEGWENEITEEWVIAHVEKEYEKNLAASKTWPQPTDTERFHEVFDSLCRENIVALHNAGYTTADAVYDVQDVWKDLEDMGVKPKGYCYYHGQDLERAIEEGELCIGFYGEKEHNDKEAILIGNKVTELLKKANFKVTWNGTASQRITIEDFNWQNVFTSEEDVEEKWGYGRVLKLMEA